MHTSAAAPALAIAALTALGTFSVPALAESTNIPTNAYYDRTLSPDEKAAIAEEEAVTPNDGKPSVPAPGDQDVIPDAADPQKGDATVAAPPSGDLPGDVPSKAGKSRESEADVILDDAKKNFKVTKKDLENCMKDWDAQSQMSKAEWERSCRTTLEYFPDGD